MGFNFDNTHSNSNDNPFDINNMMSNDLWNFSSTPSTSNYVWPTGFTPEGQPSVSSSMSMPTMNPIQVQQPQARFQEPTIGHFMNTSPNTDMRLLNALESGAAYIEGNPNEDEDIELFYYRFVSSPLCFWFPTKEGHRKEGSPRLTLVRSNSSTSRYKSNISKIAKTKRLNSNRTATRIRRKPTPLNHPRRFIRLIRSPPSTHLYTSIRFVLQTHVTTFPINIKTKNERSIRKWNNVCFFGMLYLCPWS